MCGFFRFDASSCPASDCASVFSEFPASSASPGARSLCTPIRCRRPVVQRSIQTTRTDEVCAGAVGRSAEDRGACWHPCRDRDYMRPSITGSRGLYPRPSVIASKLSYDKLRKCVPVSPGGSCMDKRRNLFDRDRGARAAAAPLRNQARASNCHPEHPRRHGIGAGLRPRARQAAARPSSSMCW